MNTLQFSGQKRNNNYKKITQNAYLFHMLYRFLAWYELVSKLARLKKITDYLQIFEQYLKKKKTIYESMFPWGMKS